MGLQSRATTPLKEMFQQQTGWELQLLPAMARALIGEQVNPT